MSADNNSKTEASQQLRRPLSNSLDINSAVSVRGRKGTPFPRLQCSKHFPPEIVTTIGKGTCPLIGGLNLIYSFPNANFAR